MISLCPSNSSFELKRELAEKDIIIEHLISQIDTLLVQHDQKPKGEKRRRSSFFKSLAKRFSFHKAAKAEERALVMSCDDAEYSAVVVEKLIVPLKDHDNDLDRRPRARSVSADLVFNESFHASKSLFTMSTDYLILTDEKTILTDEECLLVYGCQRDLVKFLKDDYMKERERRWLINFHTK